MHDEKKIAFITKLSKQALDHMASTPNVQHADGWTHDKMLAFINATMKKGLMHFDAGGPVNSMPMANTTLGGPTTLGGGANTNIGNGVVGAIGQSLGSQNNFQASGAPIQAGTNVGQLNTGYNAAQNGITGVQNVANTLAPGVAAGTSAQNQLTQMYLNQANGTGPNPAQAQLNLNTGANIAQTAALMAGQRGAGANPGLAAVNAAQTGAATQQTAAGQEAQTEAQQQLAAEQNLQNLAGTQVAQGQTAAQGVSNATQNEQNILQGANTSFNNAAVGMQSNLNNVNAQTAAANTVNNQNIASGLGNFLASAPIIGSLFAEGGVVGESTAPGANSFVGNWLTSTPNTSGPNVEATPAFTAKPVNPLGFIKKPSAAPAAPMNPADTAQVSNALSGGSAGLAGGPGDAMAGAGSAADLAVLVAKGGKILPRLGKGPVKTELTKGGLVKADTKAEKATKPGDNYDNDKIPALLTEGEVVLDKKTLADPGVIGQMARALAQHLAKRGTK